MPIPFLLIGLGVAGAVGVGSHIDASGTNNLAEYKVSSAKKLYNSAKESLEAVQEKTEKDLIQLGQDKKDVLDKSFQSFIQSYQRIKNLELRESVGLEELSKFMIDPYEVVQIQRMTNIYSASLSSGVAGAASGTLVSLAASGSLPLVTGTLSTAGSALVAGKVGVAASALTSGATGIAGAVGAAGLAGFASVAAPVVLFTGISANIKADENWEKAKEYYAEAEAAVEKMKAAETLCKAISERSNMYDDLLKELNTMFSDCTVLLNHVVLRKAGVFGDKKVDAADFTQEELRLVSVTRSLAGAIKAIIDTPILSAEGELDDTGLGKYNEAKNLLPNFEKQVYEVKCSDL